MEATFASFVKLMDERHAASEARMDRMEAMMTEIRAEVRSLRTTIIVTAISSVLAAVFGISAIITTSNSNMLAALQAGNEIAATHAEVRRIVEETAILLKRAQKEQDKKDPPKQSPPG